MDEITKKEIEEVSQLFLDGKASAKILAEHEASYLQ